MPPIVDKLKVLHDAVGEEYALGTLDDFRAKMMVPEKRKAFFNAVGRKYSLGDFNEFDKKVTSSYPVPLEQPTPTPPDLTWQGGAAEASKPAPAKPPAPIATPKRAPGEVPLGPGGIDIKIQTPEQRDFQRAAALGNARRERELRESLGIDKRELTVGERVGSFAGNFNKVIVSGVSGIPKLGGMVRNFVGTMLGEDQPIQSRDLYKLGNLIDEKALEWGFTATTPGSEGFLNEVVPSALGSVMIVALSGGTGGGSIAAGEQLVLNSAKVGLLPATGAALKEVGEHMVSRAGLTSANMMGIQEFEAAKAAGASDEMAIGVYFKNLGVGATEAIPLQRAFARINAYTSGGLIGVMKAGTVGSIEEGAQEAIQQYLTNKVAAGSYDPKREPFKDMIQSVGAGMFVGFFMPGIITAMKSMSPEQQEATKLELNKALKEVGVEPGVTAPTGDLGKKPVVQGTVAITPEPLATSKDGAGVTVQTYGTGLKDGAGKEYKVETLTATDGTTIHQSEDGTIKGETREEVAQQIALQGAPAEAKEAPAPKAPAGATTVEKKETVTPVGKKTETKTVSPKSTKTSKKVVAGEVTTTTTVTTTKKEPAKKATAKKEPAKKETKKAESAKETAPAPKAKVVMPYTVRAAAQELGINYDTPEFKKISKEVTGKEHLDDMNEAELAVMLDLVNASAKPKTNAVQERSTAPVPVEPAPGRSKEVGQKVREPQKPAVTRQGQKEKAVVPAPVVPMGNVPAMQQRVVKTKTGEGYATVKKHNLKSGDKIYPIVEMKKGGETIFVNTKGDAFKNKADALAKAVVANRPEVKPKKKAVPAPAPVAEVPKKEVPKKEPAKKKEAPAPSQAWRKKYTAYTTAGLRDFLNNLPPSERNNPANKELFAEMQEELRLRSEGKAKKAMERGREARGEKPAPVKEEPKPAPVATKEEGWTPNKNGSISKGGLTVKRAPITEDSEGPEWVIIADEANKIPKGDGTFYAKGENVTGFIFDEHTDAVADAERLLAEPAPEPAPVAKKEPAKMTNAEISAKVDAAIKDLNRKSKNVTWSVGLEKMPDTKVYGRRRNKEGVDEVVAIVPVSEILKGDWTSPLTEPISPEDIVSQFEGESNEEIQAFLDDLKSKKNKTEEEEVWIKAFEILLSRHREPMVTGLDNVGSVKEGLTLIANSDSLFAPLAKWMLENADAEGLAVKVEKPKTLGDARGAYYPALDVIRIGDFGYDHNTVFIHEVIHALTAKKIKAELGADHAFATFGNRDFLQDYVNKKGGDENIKTIVRAYIQAKKALSLSAHKDQYGFSNIDEFIAESFSNKEFQQELAKLPGENKKSVWQNLVDAIGKMLGIPVRENSLLDTVLRSAAGLASSKRVDQKKVPKAKPVVRAEQPDTGFFKKPTELAPVSVESMDILDLLSSEIFPETVDDFTEALSATDQYSGISGGMKALARLQQMQAEGLVQINKRKITPTFTKQGNEYAPQNIAEYTPETTEALYASNSGKKQPLGIVGAPISMPNWIQELDIKEFIGSTGKFLQKYFTTRGHLPKAAFDAWNKTTSAQRRYEALAEQAINRLKAQVKKDYKILTEADIVKLNLALEGKTTDPDGNALEIPTETMRVINDMRNQVDNLTRQIVYSGNVEGELAAKLMSNLGVYLHRSYRKFSDPLWKDEVGEAAFNRAMKFLKDKYPAYSQEKLDGLIEYLLHSPDAPMRAVRGGTMAGMDLSALKKRKDDKELAPEIRALMGVYADPIVNFSRSVAKMSQLITKNLFQQDVFKDGIATTLDANGNTVDMTVAEAEAAGKYLFRDHVPGYTTKIESTGIPSPLDGLYTSKDISDVLAEFNGGQQPNPDWVKFILRGTGAVNLGLTVFSPTTHGRNFFSNTLYFIMNGYKVPFSSKIDDRFSTKVEGNVEAREAERAATVKEQADIGKLQITASEDLAHASKMQSKVDAKVKEIAAIEKRAVKAKESLDKATTASDKTLRKARLDIIGRNLTRAKGRLKAMQDTMAGVSKATELAEARQAGKDLITKGAPAEEIKRAQDKVHRLEKWERESGVFRDAKVRLADLAARESAMAQKGVPIELPSTLESSAWEDKLVEWKQYGMIDEGVSGGMISEFLDDARSRATTDYRGSGLSEKESIKSKAVHGAKKLYQAGDWFWKAIAYENELVRYKKAYPDMAESELKQMVSNIVRDIHPTYSRISKGVRTLRNIPGAGAFVSFPAEVVRTFSNTVVLAKKEITSGNEELRKVGIKRAAGVLTALSLPTMASLATRALMGMDDKDEESLRNNLPEWSRNSTLMYLNKERKTEPYLTTKYRIIDFGAFDPFAVLKKPFTALLFQNQPIGDRIWNSAGQVLKPFVNQQVLTSKVSDALRNQKPNGGNIYNEADPLWMQISDGLGYITSASAPGIIKSGLNLKKAAAGEKSETGKEYKLNDELLAIFPGARVSTIDITYGTEIYATNEINRLLLQVRRDAMKDVRYANEEEAKAGREAFVRRNKAVLKRARRIYDDAIRLGADPRVLNNIQWPREMEGLWE